MPSPWNRCKPIINYDGTSIKFSGLESDEIINFRIGDFKINKELLQAATDIAKIYDLFRVSNCKRIKEFSKDSAMRDHFILEAMKSNERLLEFLTMLRLTSTHPSEKIEKALADSDRFYLNKNHQS